MSNQNDTAKKQLWAAIRWPLIFVGIIWFIYLVEFIGGFHWGKYGILPQRASGLKGILFSPWLHGSLGHLLSNSVPVFVIGSVMYYFYSRVATQALLWLWLLAGMGTWLIGRNSFHIGASGVVYGMLTFVLFSGLFRRSRQSIIISLLFTTIYTGYFAGIVPGEDGVSWESHLSGAIAGILVAFGYKNMLETEEIPPPKEPELKDFFLPSDIFEKTKYERYLEEQQRIQNNWESNSTDEF